MSDGMGEYTDVQSVYRRLDALMDLPPIGLERSAIQGYVELLEERCAGSKKMTTEAREYIPGGVQHNLAFNYPFPIVAERAEGPYLFDIDGNRYIDFLQAGGATILGTNPPEIRGQMIELLEHCGPVTGLFHSFELKLAKEVSRHMPAVEMFRMLGGAQGYFGVRPDLTVFGKLIAGGYPSAGGLGGRKDLINHLAAGLEGGTKRAMVGGTLAANPLSAAAGYYTIREIERTDACAVAGRAGHRITRGLNDLFAKHDLPYVAYNQGPICHVQTSGAIFVRLNLLKILQVIKEAKARKFVMEEFGAAFMAEGIVTLAGSRLYTGAVHTDEVIDDALDRFDRIFQKVDRTALPANG